MQYQAAPCRRLAVDLKIPKFNRSHPVLIHSQLEPAPKEYHSKTLVRYFQLRSLLQQDQREPLEIRKVNFIFAYEFGLFSL